jgi:hypothetical protein
VLRLDGDVPLGRGSLSLTSTSVLPAGAGRTRIGFLQPMPREVHVPQKLRLDPDALAVASFDTGSAPNLAGTVRANDLEALVASQTNCRTTPCCAPSVTCPTPALPCA